MFITWESPSDGFLGQQKSPSRYAQGKNVKKYKSNDSSELLYIMSIHCIYIEEVAFLSIICKWSTYLSASAKTTIFKLKKTKVD